MDGRRIAAELRKIETQEGRLTPADVIAAARPPKHPLHSQFEWDDKVAGEQYRIEQARRLIRSVRVMVQVDERTIKAVAYVRDPAADHEDQGYRAIVNLATDEDAARAAIVAAFADAAAHLRRARDLASALGLAAEVDDLIERVASVDSRLRETMAAAS